MAHKIEESPTGRAACRGCKEVIPKGTLRFAEELANLYSEDGGTSFRYWHLRCAAEKLANEVRDALAQFGGTVDDRESIVAIVGSHLRPDMPFAERAGSGRARCRSCDAAIRKGDLRVVFERLFDSAMGPQKGAAYAHPKCVARYLERESERGRPSFERDDAVRRIRANTHLTEDDLGEVLRAIADGESGPADPIEKDR